MVWFQCDDCGEEIKKPKLPNHFRICSAGRLSCLDCGVGFTPETVQGHTQCITEAEKYGPKGETRSSHSAQSKSEKPKKNADVDIHVGLSSRAPWFCSLCNAKATSRQTLMAHADGKKHRAKARAHHAAQNQTAAHAAEQLQTKDSSCDATQRGAKDGNDTKKPDDKISAKQNSFVAEVEDGGKKSKKRKNNVSTGGGDEQKNVCHADTNGEVIQADSSVASEKFSKKQKLDGLRQNGHAVDKDGHFEENSKKKIKWKKLVTKTLKLNADGAMKLKKLQKLVVEAIKELGVSEDEVRLQEKFTEKVTSSSRFVIEGKSVRLAAKGPSL